MQINVLKETEPGETRVALIPDHIKKLAALKASVAVESGAGVLAGAQDADYEAAGAHVLPDRAALLAGADILLTVNRPNLEDLVRLKKGATVIGFLKPFDEAEMLRPLLEHGLAAFAMELIPRSTIAQKMDALSSQASLAGYVAVIVAAERAPRVLPMMSTPAGTISPARVFIIGAGVAGLQAIATARRLGARVEAFDVRPEVEEQIKSLGAKFIKVDLGETGSTQQGYAKQLSAEQLDKQREVMARQCAISDIVITTAQVFGRKAPLIITTEMVQGMKPGSVVVDLAVESGGNVECSKLNEEIWVNDVHIVGLPQLARYVPVHASQVYSSNLCSLLEHCWNKETQQLNLDAEDDVMKSGLIIRNHEVRNETMRNLLR
jgi:H+-translocating NAD(P) transhydrogenase subunit alpha